MKRTIWNYLKDYKFKSLLFRSFLYIILGVVAPLLIVVFYCYHSMSKEMNQRIADMNEEILQRNMVVVDNIMISVLDVLVQMTEQKEVAYIVEDGNLDVSDDEKMHSAIRLIKEYMDFIPYVHNIYIYSDRNGLIIDRKDVGNANEVTRKGKWYYIYKNISMEMPYILVDSKDSIYVCRQLWSDTGKRDGILVFEVGLQKIRNMLETEKIEQNGMFFIQDIGGQLLYCSHQSFYSLSKAEQKVYVDMISRAIGGETGHDKIYSDNIISVSESVHHSWRYALVTARGAYEGEIEQSTKFLYYSLLLGIFVGTIVACLVTYFTYRPVRKIIDVIEEPQLYMETEVDSEQPNELLYITSNILNNIRSKKNIDVELKQRIQVLRQAQAKVLQFQMNPHFLYNTLETIKWCSIEDMGIGNRTGKAIAKLAVMYRFCMNDENAILTLQEELEFTKIYIDALRIRFDEKIQYEWNVEQNICHCNVIKMCLQPLVENAVNHGLKEKLYYGNIAISAFRDQDKIYLVVENDGVGLTPGEIMRINQQFQERDRQQNRGIGLWNVNERIRLVYGENYGVRISQTEKYENGVRVNITLPYTSGEERNGV